MVKTQREKRVEQENPSRRIQDIIGISLFFIGAASLLCLFWKQSGGITQHVDTILRFIAGNGAFAIPILFMFVGSMFLIGYERLSVSTSSFGSALLFLIFLMWQHLRVVPSGAIWDTEQAQIAGGWLGGLLATGVRSLLGDAISHLFLFALLAISIVLIADQPFIVIMRRLHDRSTAKALNAGMAVVKRRKAEQEESGSRSPRVPAQRVLKSNSKSIASGPKGLDSDSEDIDSKKGFNLFSLTKSWRKNDDLGEELVLAPPPSKEEARQKLPSRRTADSEEPSDSKPISVTDITVKDANPAGTGSTFVLPPLSLLKEAAPSTSKRSPNELKDKIKILEQTLEQFNIGANVVEVASGPSVTRYEIQLAPGIKVNKIVSLADNLAMNLAAIDVRVEAPIPGKAAIGVEVPNSTPTIVTLRECLDQDTYKNAASKLTFALGKDVAGEFKYADLTRMPHLLIGGSTNSGKSVCLNVIIASLVYRSTPREVRLMMIDPKRVELSLWDGIPHLMHPVVKDVKQAAGIFRAAIKEMDRRYDIFSVMGTRNIDGYNERVPESEKLPYIILIVDELADLMMQQGPEIETSICRLAQLARATGIHLVIATQRPSVDIITGTIKANISSRIAFAVASQVDSRTILDMTGADRLIGRGDMLFMPIDAAKPLRIQGCYLSETETNNLVDYLKMQEPPSYTFTIGEASNVERDRAGSPGSEEEADDQLFEQAVRLVVNNGQASTSMLQRRFRIGYTRAARIVEMMEERGIVGGLNGAKPREILISKMEVEQLFNPGGPVPGVADYVDEGE